MNHKGIIDITARSLSCIWCGTSDDLLVDQKKYCTRCELLCKRECRGCGKPYPDIGKYFATDTAVKCNACEQRQQLVKERRKGSAQNQNTRVANMNVRDDESDDDDDEEDMRDTEDMTSDNEKGEEENVDEVDEEGEVAKTKEKQKDAKLKQNSPKIRLKQVGKAIATTMKPTKEKRQRKKLVQGAEAEMKREQLSALVNNDPNSTALVIAPTKRKTAQGKKASVVTGGVSKSQTIVENPVITTSTSFLLLRELAAVPGTVLCFHLPQLS